MNVTLRRPGDGGTGTSGLLLNVSRGGAYVATYDPLPPTTLVVLEIEIPGRTLKVPARVVHDEHRGLVDDQTIFTAGMGVSFDRPADQEAIELASLGHPLVDDGGRRRSRR